MATRQQVWTTADGAVEQRLDAHLAVLHRRGREPRIELVGPGGRRDDVLGLDLHAVVQPADEWLRGADAVAVFEPEDARRLRATAMWRIATLPPGVSGAWELVTSAQTSLLESDASMTVVSTVGGDEMLAADWPAPGAELVWNRVDRSHGPAGTTGCLLVRRHGDATSVMVAVHPGDARGLAATAETEGRMRIACPLFASQVEKGVLLRGRVLAAIGPARDDEAWATAVATAFASSPPVLET